MGDRFASGRLCLKLLLAAVLIWLNPGLALANGGGVHPGGLSGGASLAIILAGVVLTGILIAFFLWKGRQTLPSSAPSAPLPSTPPAGEESQNPEIDNRDQG